MVLGLDGRQGSDSTLTVGLGEEQQGLRLLGLLSSLPCWPPTRENRQQLLATSACKACTLQGSLWGLLLQSTSDSQLPSRWPSENTVGLPVLVLGSLLNMLSLGSKDKMKIIFVVLED